MIIQKEFYIDHRFLNLPVKNDAPKSLIAIRVGDETITEFRIELTLEEPDFWVFFDASRFYRKRLRFSVEASDCDNPASLLEAIVPGDDVIVKDPMYKEAYRPQFHFTSKRGRLNDPNGLVYFDGEYHLFYQHNPYGWKGGNLHWGHAVSRDLVHWEELPAALIPQTYLDFCYSGSASVDWHNTTGLQTGDHPVMLALFTSTGRGECLAFSRDRGRTWQEYAHNPVLVHGKLLNPFDHTEHWRSWFYHPDTGELIRPQNPPESQIRHISRDPKLFWHEPTKKWIMVVYEQDTYEAYDGKSCTFAVYSSDKATEWRKESVIPGWYECPELFELDVDADPDKRKWVLLGGDGRYVIGDFDGKAFHFEPRRPDEFDPYMTSTKFLANETYKYMGFYGKSMFAPQTFNDMPKEDGRRIQIGWLKCNMAHMPFNQMMSLPCELFLRTTEDGIRMFTRPVEELEQLRGKSYRWTGEDDQTTYRLDEDGDGLLEIVARIRIGTDETGIEIDGIKIAYNPENRKLRCELSTDSVVEAPLKAIQNEIRLHVFRDRTSIELFANDGRVHMPVAVPPDRHGPTVPSVRRLGPEPFVSLDIYALNSIWSDTDGNPA